MNRETQSYGALFWRDFTRNKLAVLSGLVVLFVLLVAVFTPLIANQRPLYIYTTFQGEYFNSLSVAKEQLELAETAGWQDHRDLAISTLRRASTHVSGDDRAELLGVIEAIQSASNVPADAVDSLFDATLVPVHRFPAFRSLNRWELFFIYLTLLTPFVYIIGNRGLLRGVATIAVISYLLMLTTKAIFPDFRDTLPYRRILSSPAFVENGGRVLRTPVPYGENENIIVEARQAPTWLIAPEDRRPDQNWHWLGTDTNGRDVLARMVYGARVSMLIGILAVGIYTIIGIVLGALAGYFGGWLDITISRIIEIVICFPALIIILAVQAFLAPSLMNIILALAFLLWTGVARLQRAEFLRLVNQDFVTSVRGLGGSNLRIIFLHILPNGLGPILVLTSFGVAGSIVVESSLSYLGFGVPQPMASWGDLLNNGKNDIKGLWWLTIFPGFAIFLTVTCFNLLGEGFRDALDPKRDQ